jgi:hypothetical protein
MPIACAGAEYGQANASELPACNSIRSELSVWHPSRLFRHEEDVVVSDEERLTAIGRWALDTCLLFGATFETAIAVAEHIVSGLRREWKMS